jgi:hypothetical protein
LSAAVAQPLPSPTIGPSGPPDQTGGGTVRADLRREYAAGGSGFWQSAFLRALPLAIDDVTADFGADLYERILLDARAAAEIDNLKAAILEDGVVLSPAVDDEGADGYRLAVEIRDAAEAMLGELEQALDDTLWDLLSGVALGNRVAEEVYDFGDLAGRTGLLLVGLRPKPRESLAFVVDPFNRLIGFLAAIPGQARAATSSLALVSAADPPPNLLPREKFAVYTHRPVNASPLGTSLLRPVYTPWVKKQQTLRDYIKYLAQFASPSLIGILGQSARNQAVIDPETGEPTGKIVTAVDALLEKLIAFHNGTALALPFGTEVKELFSQGDGAAFLRSIEMDNRDITLAITGQSLATTEGEHQARAAASVHQDILATRVKQAKKAVARVLRWDVLRPWVRLNWGDAAIPLTPLVGLGTVEEEDVTPRMNAVANLERATYIAPSQRPAIDVMLGLPQRTPEETARETERASQPPPPAPVTPGSDPGDDDEEDQP